jgi:hypothetical protein
VSVNAEGIIVKIKGFFFSNPGKKSNHFAVFFSQSISLMGGVQLLK